MYRQVRSASLQPVYFLEIPEEYEKRKRNDKTEGIAPNKKIRTAS